MTHALPLSPDAAIVLFTTGILLLYVELNRPGTILPGCLGLVFTLVSISSVLKLHPGFYPIALIVTGLALPTILLRRTLGRPFAIAPALCLAFGFQHLDKSPSSPRLHTVISMGCGLVLGLTSWLLCHIARRARANKGLDLERARTSRPGASQS